MNQIIKLKESDIIRSHPRLTVISSKIVKKNPPMRELSMAERIDEDARKMEKAFENIGRTFAQFEDPMPKPYKAEAISRADVLLAQKNHKMRMVRERRENLISLAINTAIIGVTALLTFNVLIMAIEELAR